jgi:hypothetical protein
VLVKLVLASVVVALCVAPSIALADGQVKVIGDRAAFLRQLRTRHVPERAGIAKAESDRADGHNRSFPHFTSSFTSGGVNYPYTMVGYAPTTGKTTHIKAVIVPLRMRFVGFGTDAVFEPTVAVNNILNSPLFNDATFANGVGQFGDQMQRATFWNKMDDHHKWHVIMDRPRVARTIDVLVEPDVGEMFAVGPGPGDILGNVRFGFMDAQIHTALQFMHIDEDELPIFVTDNVFADALGYHDAFVQPNGDTNTLQTLIYTSWLDGALVGDLLADVSTINHELGEWLNDPYVNNFVPTWEFPPLNVTCSNNPLLEVGDPQGNGPQFDSFPTVPITIGGVTYHLQDLVMLPWFTGESPSTAQNGWYDFPATNQITTPRTVCP